ncbi:MAG: hypothetical protein ACRC4K_16030 [Plesiomonas shigelloides]
MIGENMKKIFLAIACVTALAGCKESVSGKYEGTWANDGIQYKVESKGDYYRVERISKSFGNSSFKAKEDSEGYLVFDDEPEKRLLKYKDSTTATNGSGDWIFTKVKQ